MHGVPWREVCLIIFINTSFYFIYKEGSRLTYCIISLFWKLNYLFYTCYQFFKLHVSDLHFKFKFLSLVILGLLHLFLVLMYWYLLNAAPMKILSFVLEIWYRWHSSLWSLNVVSFRVNN